MRVASKLDLWFVFPSNNGFKWQVLIIFFIFDTFLRLYVWLYFLSFGWRNFELNVKIFYHLDRVCPLICRLSLRFLPNVKHVILVITLIQHLILKLNFVNFPDDFLRESRFLNNWLLITLWNQVESFLFDNEGIVKNLLIEVNIVLRNLLWGLTTVLFLRWWSLSLLFVVSPSL